MHKIQIDDDQHFLKVVNIGGALRCDVSRFCVGVR